VGFYSLPNSSDYETSSQIWGSRTSYIYGGEFQGLDGQFHASPTVVTDAAVLDPEFTANVTEGPSGDTEFPDLVDVSLTGTTADFDCPVGCGVVSVLGHRRLQQ
jgi:hypothetical protein